MLKKIVAGLLLASALPTMASALTYDFAFTSGSFYSGSGTLTTADTTNSLGGYDITGIAGSFGEGAITGLIPNPTPPDVVLGTFNTYDNVLFPGALIKFDEYGVAFNVGTSVYNIYNATVEDNAPAGTPYGLLVNGDGPVLGTFTLTQAGPVPESSTWAMLIVGFGMVGGTIRQSRKARQFAV